MTPPLNQIILGDSLEVLKTLESESVDCCITSPPYNVGIDYGEYKDNLELLCANCHRIHTWEQMGYRKTPNT